MILATSFTSDELYAALKHLAVGSLIKELVFDRSQQLIGSLFILSQALLKVTGVYNISQ